MKNDNRKKDTPPKSPMELSGEIAKRFGYELNPDQSQLNQLVQHLTENKEKYGRYFCPCKQNYPVNPETDPVCPCPTFHEEIKQQGHCECHLFYSVEAAALRRERPGLLADVTCPG